MSETWLHGDCFCENCDALIDHRRDARWLGCLPDPDDPPALVEAILDNPQDSHCEDDPERLCRTCARIWERGDWRAFEKRQGRFAA
ncbi:MAG: hypothetical protein OXH76_20830 [Boseongicola sp.]|nr:hypothetical protein [Boseongicola sp.]